MDDIEEIQASAIIFIVKPFNVDRVRGSLKRVL